MGHSAGSVVLASVIERLIAEGIPVESLQLMGGAIRVDHFVRQVVPQLASVPNGTGMVGRFTAYDLKDGVELDDTCPGPPVPVYHSLLYFVARALEPCPGAVRDADGRPDQARPGDVPDARRDSPAPARRDRRSAQPGPRRRTTRSRPTAGRRRMGKAHSTMTRTR